MMGLRQSFDRSRGPCGQIGVDVLSWKDAPLPHSPAAARRLVDHGGGGITCPFIMVELSSGSFHCKMRASRYYLYEARYNGDASHADLHLSVRWSLLPSR